MGPLPAPEIPHYDLWVRKDGRRTLTLQPQLDANWVQPMENSMDPAHLQILHQTLAFGGRTPPNTTRGFTDEVAGFDFYETEYGIIKHREYRNGHTDEHPVIFPNILRQANATQIRVPIDDEHTKIFFVRFDPTPDGSIVEDEGDPEVVFRPSYKQPAGALHPNMKFDMQADVQAQDHMAWETQGPIANRSIERLATTDRGIVMYRQILKREIEKVQMGLDPKCTWRDPDHPMIDTKLQLALDERRDPVRAFGAMTPAR